MFGGCNAHNFISDHSYISPADGLLRFEFSDAAASLTGLFNAKGKRSIGQRRTGLLRDILQHDELYKNYPEVAAVPFELYWWHKRGKVALIDSQLVKLEPAIDESPEKTLGSLCHEVQHVIQLIEGFSDGGSSDYFYAVLRHQHLKQSGQSYLTGEESRVLRQQADDTYYNLPGEKEARDVSKRRSWSMEQRLAEPPVNVKLADDKTGVTFAPRETLSVRERLALAFLARKRRQLTGASPR